MANVPHRRVLKGHKECINCIDSTTSSRNLIATGSDDKSVRLWDIRTNKAIKCVVQCFESSVEAVKFSVSDDNILFAASSNSLFNFDLRKDGIIIKNPVSVTTDAATDEINTIAVSMSGDFVAVGDDSGVATILETNNLKAYKPKRLNGHNSLVNAIAFSPVNPNGFVTGGFDCLLSTWDLDNTNSPKSSVNMAKLTLCTESTTKSINPPFVQNLSYIFQGQAIVVALGDGSLKVVDADDPTCLWAAADDAHAGMATSLYSDSDNTLYSGGIDRTVKYWSLDLPESSSKEIDCATEEDDTETNEKEDESQSVPLTKLEKEKIDKKKRKNKKKNKRFLSNNYRMQFKLLWDEDHGEKINVINGFRSFENESPPNIIFVADTTPDLSIYDIY